MVGSRPTTKEEGSAKHLTLQTYVQEIEGERETTCKREIERAELTFHVERQG